MATDRRKLKSHERYILRKQTIDLLRISTPISEVAEKTGYHQSSVYLIKKQLEARELTAVGVAGKKGDILVGTGRPRSINRTNDELIFKAIIGCEKIGTPYLWDRLRVENYIKTRLNIDTNKQQSLRVLKRLGFVFRNQMERLELKAPDWLRNEYPEILKHAKKSGGDIFIIDTANVALELLRKYGEVRESDITFDTKHVITVFGAINLKNEIKFWTTPNKLSSSQLINFISHLLEECSHPLHFVLEKYQVCNTNQFVKFAESRKNSLNLHFFTT